MGSSHSPGSDLGRLLSVHVLSLRTLSSSSLSVGERQQRGRKKSAGSGLRSLHNSLRVKRLVSATAVAVHSLMQRSMH